MVQSCSYQPQDVQLIMRHCTTRNRQFSYVFYSTSQGNVVARNLGTLGFFFCLEGINIHLHLGKQITFSDDSFKQGLN